MKWLYILVISVMVVGCSSVKHSAGSSVAPQQESRIENDTLHKEVQFVTIKQNVVQNSEQDSSISDTIITEKKVRPAIIFSPEEQGEIRYTAGFFGNGEMSRRIELDSLKAEFCFPLARYVVYSKYGIRNGRTHTGVDLSASASDSIRCVWPGVVRMAKAYGAYGNVVIVHHYNGLETLYAHLSKINVRPNQVVEEGELLGFVGKTGRATGNHLHLEIRAAGEHFDPLKVLDTKNRTVKSGTMMVYHKVGRSVVSFGEDTPAPVELKPATSLIEDSAAAQAVYHKVVKGDTLWALARKYNTSVAKICSLNGIKSNAVLGLGKKLRVK